MSFNFPAIIQRAVLQLPEVVHIQPDRTRREPLISFVAVGAPGLGHEEKSPARGRANPATDVDGGDTLHREEHGPMLENQILPVES
jgi:hypothetical protein